MVGIGEGDIKNKNSLKKFFELLSNSNTPVHA